MDYWLVRPRYVLRFIASRIQLLYKQVTLVTETEKCQLMS